MSQVAVALDSGAEFLVAPAPFRDAYELQKALLAAAKGTSLDRDFLEKDLSCLTDAVIQAATSPAVESALFKCLGRCAWNKQAVTPDLFDDPTQGDAARRDFYRMAWECVKANCAPFFEGAFSKLRAALRARTTEPPASK